VRADMKDQQRLEKKNCIAMLDSASKKSNSCLNICTKQNFLVKMSLNCPFKYWISVITLVLRGKN